MHKINSYLYKTLSIGWLSFLAVGLAIALLFPIPQITLLVDRSYCPPSQWQQPVQTYTDLYQQHQQKRLQIKQIVIFSNFNQETLSNLLTPTELANLSTYGRSNQQLQMQLEKNYPDVRVLQCP